MTGPPALITPPGDHGVAVYARDLAAAVGARHPSLVTVEPDDLGRLPDGTAAHAHFTDRLWADSPEQASGRFAALADRLRLSVTLHDVPQASDGERNRERRRAAYAAVAASARGVVVNSDHERALLREEGVAPYPGTVAYLDALPEIFVR